MRAAVALVLSKSCDSHCLKSGKYDCLDSDTLRQVVGVQKRGQRLQTTGGV